MPDLADNLSEYRPLGLIGMPVWLATQLGKQCFVDGLEQWCNGLQATGQCARGHAQTVISKILQ